MTPRWGSPDCLVDGETQIGAKMGHPDGVPKIAFQILLQIDTKIGYYTFASRWDNQIKPKWDSLDLGANLGHPIWDTNWGRPIWDTNWGHPILEPILSCPI